MEEEEENEETKTSVKFAQSIIEQVNRSDIEAMVQVQRDMLSRYEKTNEMLINFNLLSLSRHEATSQEFKNHTQVLYEMKKDLDNIFRRIRVLKQKLGTMYPEAFSVCSDVYNMMSEEEDETTETDQENVKHSKNPDQENVIHSKDPDQENVKHSKDPDSTCTKDGMNDMLENHENSVIENNSNLSHNITFQNGEGDSHIKTNSEFKDKIDICSSGVKQIGNDSVSSDDHNSKHNSVIENG